MQTRTFETSNGYKLVIKSRKSAVILEIDEELVDKHYQYWFDFTSKDFAELTIYFEDIANKCWSNFVPKVADSLGADYYEYYDKELDCNGYLSIKLNGLFIERPSLESTRLYQFNKKKMESFIFDLR